MTYHDLDGKDDRTEGAATGGSIGAAAGGAAGLLAGLGLIAIPGVGPVVAAGWLVATLTRALAGGATGGVISGHSIAKYRREAIDCDFFSILACPRADGRCVTVSNTSTVTKLRDPGPSRALACLISNRSAFLACLFASCTFRNCRPIRPEQRTLVVQVCRSPLL
jgi:hypothetical protein